MSKTSRRPGLRTATLAAIAVAGGLLVAGPAHADTGTYYNNGSMTPTSTGTLGTGVGAKLTGAQMVTRALDWVSHNVTYNQGQSFSDAEVGGPYRTDCGGLVDMAWQLTSSPVVTTPSPGIDSSTYSTKLSSWSQLQPGDALAVSGEHINLFAGWINQSAGTFHYIAEDNPSVPTGEYSASTSDSSIDGYPKSSFELLRSNNLAPAIPAGFNIDLWGFNSGQTLSGTVNLTAHPTQQGVINSLTYQITGPNGYNSGPLAPSAGGASNYPLAFDTIPLAPGTYTVSMTANEIDGQNHTYVGGSFTLLEPQGTNVLRAANGTIAVYNVGTDGNVYGTNQNTVGGPFNGWAQISSGIPFTGKVAAIQDSSGAISLYARSTDGYVWGTTQVSAGGAFGNWNTVGGSSGVASDPAVLLTRNGTVAIYVTNGVGDISGTSQNTVGGTFSNWASLGAPAGMTGRPSVIQDSAGRITVYARNTNGWLYGTTQVSAGGAFGNWNTVGGSSGVASDPAVLLTQNGTVAIYVTNGVGDISGTSQNTVGGTFSNWASLGAPAGMTGRPSVIQDSAGRITVYAHNTNGWLYGTTQFSAGSAFGNWNTVGNNNPVATSAVGDPTALIAADETVAVYTKDSVGDVLGVSQFSVGGAFGNWQMM